jgi:hypothetical protein
METKSNKTKEQQEPDLELSLIFARLDNGARAILWVALILNVLAFCLYYGYAVILEDWRTMLLLRKIDEANANRGA